MKSKMFLIFFLLANLFALISMDMITENQAVAEDPRIQEIKKNLDHCLKEQRQQQSLLELEVKVSTLLEKINRLEQVQEQQKNSNKNIVIQRRQDGSVDFYRNWNDYKSGFGNETGEFFIGLEKLHELTNSRLYELLIIMEDFDLRRRYAKYDYFVVGNEVENFILKSIGTYKGSAADSLSYHVGQQFSTMDRDQDSSSSLNCAEKYHGAWWFDYCQKSNLNGPYKTSGSGITWAEFSGSLKFVEMILVPKYSL